jgi:hypothetical protein
VIPTLGKTVTKDAKKLHFDNGLVIDYKYITHTEYTDKQTVIKTDIFMQKDKQTQTHTRTHTHLKLQTICKFSHFYNDTRIKRHN